MQEYREQVFEGALPVVKAFLTGLKLGRGWAGEFVFSEQRGIRGESFGHRILEKLKVEKDLTHVLVMERQAARIAAATRESRKELGLVIRRDRAVREARFGYQFHVYNRRAAGKVRKALATIPKSLARIDAEVNEEVHPEGRGVEGYAPEHEYAFTGKGSVVGPVDDVLAYHNVLTRIEWLLVEPISLALG